MSAAASLGLNGTTQFISRAFGTPTSNTIWTFAHWFKAAAYGTTVIESDAPGNLIWFNAGVLTFSDTNGGSNAVISPTATPTDTTTWHHYCWQIDTTQATATNRIKIWIDGVDKTNTAGTYPAQNAATAIFGSATTFYLGTDQNAGPRLWLSGKLSNIYLVDGQSLDATSFISGTGSATCYDKGFSGTLGTNGFFLSFVNGASQTTLGYDDARGNPGAHSGANDWTLTNTPTQSTSDFPPYEKPNPRPMQLAPMLAQ